MMLCMVRGRGAYGARVEVEHDGVVEHGVICVLLLAGVDRMVGDMARVTVVTVWWVGGEGRISCVTVMVVIVSVVVG